MIKEQIKMYIEKNYFKLHCLAKKFDRELADDLLSVVVRQILEMKKLDGLENAYKKNIFVYIFVAMKRQYKTPGSEFNKLYNDYDTRNYCEFKIEERDVELSDEDDFRLEIIYDYIDSKEFHKSFSSESDYFYCKTLWLMYYKPEHQYSIKDLDGLSLKEIEKIRKVSFRKMGNQTDIDHRSINKTINIVNDKIKKHLGL